MNVLQLYIYHPPPILVMSEYEFGIRVRKINDDTLATSNVLSEYMVKGNGINLKQDRQCMYTLTLRCLRATVVAVEKQ
jgi:hypothetical protein